jgi:hypothetical protein
MKILFAGLLLLVYESSGVRISYSLEKSITFIHMFIHIIFKSYFSRDSTGVIIATLTTKKKPTPTPSAGIIHHHGKQIKTSSLDLCDIYFKYDYCL